MSDNSTPKLDAFDKLVVEVAKANPDKTNFGIAKEISALEVGKSKDAVFNKMNRRSYLIAEIDEIKTYHNELLHREILPLALKKHKKALKDKDLPANVAFQYVKLAEDKAFGEGMPHGGININIGQIQALIQQGMAVK